MSLLFDFQRFVRIDPGLTTFVGHVILGSFDETDRDSRYKLRAVRVGFNRLPFDTQARITAQVIVAGGCQIGPIDVPFRMNLELPVQIDITSELQDEQVTVMCTAADLPDPPNLLGATYLQLTGSSPAIADEAGPKVPITWAIPYWVCAITVFSGDTVTLYDVHSSTIGTFTGPQPVARPREAVALSTANGSAVLFHY